MRSSSSRTPTTVDTPPPVPLGVGCSSISSSLFFFLNATNHPNGCLGKRFLVNNLSRISEIYPHRGSITITVSKTLGRNRVPPQTHWGRSSSNSPMEICEYGRIDLQADRDEISDVVRIGTNRSTWHSN